MNQLQPLPTVKLGDDGFYTPFDLPPPEIKNWSSKTKLLFVLAIQGGLISREDFASRYNVPLGELSVWEARYQRKGRDGLKTLNLHHTRLDEQRGHTPLDESAYMVDNLTLIRDSQLAVCGSWACYLTNSEFNMLALLLRQRGHVVTWDMFYDHLYVPGRRLPTVDLFTVHMHRIKRKLLPEYAVRIKVVRGRGYVFN